MEPMSIGTIYEGQRIVHIIDSDDTDDYQPYLYMLEDGTTVWIPVSEYPFE